MSVTSVTELPPPKGERSNTASFVRSFQVITDSSSDGPETVLSDGRLPTLYSPYYSGNEINGSALCVNRMANRNSESRTVWTVDVEYDTAQSRRHGGQHEEDNPLLRPAIYEWDAILTQKIALKTINATAQIAAGGMITNSAGFQYDPPPMIDDFRRVLRVTRNEWPFNEGVYVQYDNAVNSMPWRGYAERTWKCAPIKATGPQTENGIQFWTVRFEFHYQRDTWDIQLLDAGYQDINGDIKDARGEPTTHPWPLNGSGVKLANPQSLTPSQFKYRTAQCYYSADFNQLNIFPP